MLIQYNQHVASSKTLKCALSAHRVSALQYRIRGLEITGEAVDKSVF